jgi:hypothetical protein
MRTIKLKAAINYTVNIEQTIEVSEEDNRISLHDKAKELALIGIESNPNTHSEVRELYIADIDPEGNPIVWVRP